jgi:hypothetical protein
MEAPQSPTATTTACSSGGENLDFDNLLEKQRELLKQIRSTPPTTPSSTKDTVHKKLTTTKKASPSSSKKKQQQSKDVPEWGWSFERIPPSRNKKSKKQHHSDNNRVLITTAIAEEGNEDEEWISNWSYERVCSNNEGTVTTAATSTTAGTTSYNGGQDSEASIQWYFERVPPTQAQLHPYHRNGPPEFHHDDDEVMKMVMDDDDDDADRHDEFARFEAAVHCNADDISLEDFDIDPEDVVITGDDGDDDVIMSVGDDDEGLLPAQAEEPPQFIQELKHRQNASTYMHELKHRQAEGGYGIAHNHCYGMVYKHEIPPPPSYTNELKAVVKPVAAAAPVLSEDFTMMGDDKMETPDSSDHKPTSSGSSGSSPTSVMDASTMKQVAAATAGHPDVRLPCAEGMDDIFKNTLQKLTESMKRSAESRRSLTIKTEHTQEYERNLCVHQILQSVKSSSRQVDTCLQIYRPRTSSSSSSSSVGSAPVPAPS